MSGTLVSCIMPTHDRRRFVPRAIAWFLRQTHAASELVVVDDGSDAVGDLMPVDPRVVYVRLGRRHTVGCKRNIACEVARGDVLMHWDDDDWYAPDRVQRQLEALELLGADVCGTSAATFYDVDAQRACRYRYPESARRWVYGATLAYRRSYWAANRFEDVDVGEDSRFVWRAAPERIEVVADDSFYVGTIHAGNVSPKETRGPYWTSLPAEAVEARLGPDLDAFVAPPRRLAARNDAPLRNVHAALVHEEPACVADLVRNLRLTDPDSQVLLYDGSASGDLLADRAAYERLGAVIHPAPRPMRWGYLHDFAFDAMRFALDVLGAQTMTVVDSDQLAVRRGYSAFLAAHLPRIPAAGLLGTSDIVQTRGTPVAPASAAWNEFPRWQPLLRGFANGAAQFVRWTFWPSTVFTEPAMRELCALRRSSTALEELLNGTRMWAVEEILFPTLVALLGFTVARNPCSPELVRYRVPCTERELRRAFTVGSIFWIHPVPRSQTDETRIRVRQHLGARPESSHAPTHHSTSEASTMAITLRNDTTVPATFSVTRGGLTTEIDVAPSDSATVPKGTTYGVWASMTDGGATYETAPFWFDEPSQKITAERRGDSEHDAFELVPGPPEALGAITLANTCKTKVLFTVVWSTSAQRSAPARNAALQGTFVVKPLEKTDVDTTTAYSFSADIAGITTDPVLSSDPDATVVAEGSDEDSYRLVAG